MSRSFLISHLKLRTQSLYVQRTQSLYAVLFLELKARGSQQNTVGLPFYPFVNFHI